MTYSAMESYKAFFFCYASPEYHKTVLRALECFAVLKRLAMKSVGIRLLQMLHKIQYTP